MKTIEQKAPPRSHPKDPGGTVVARREPVEHLGPIHLSEPFSSHVAAAFSFPFAGHCRYVMIGGTVLFAVVGHCLGELLNSPLVLLRVLAVLIGVFISGYVVDYLFGIVRSTAAGRDVPTDWPDLLRPWQSCVLPLVRMVAIFGASFGLSLLATRWPGTDGPTFWMLLVLGLLYYPMAVVSVAMRGSLAGLSPRPVMTSISTIPRDYIVACGIFAALLVAAPFSVIIAGVLPVVGIPLGAAALLYLLLVMMRILGLIYLEHRDALDSG